jgi:hypothetical protein
MSGRGWFGLWVLVVSCVVWAQTPTAEFTGTVTDATGAVVGGARVTVTNLSTNLQRVITTNSAGVYDAPALPPGTYSVRVELAGFRSEVRNNIEVQVGQVARLNFTLQVGNVTETVEVQAEAPTLDTETTTVGTVIERRRIEELPLNGRNYLQLASLIPGSTTYAPPIGQTGTRMGGARAAFSLNVAGARTNFNSYSLDGVVNTDPNFGTYLFQPSVDALQEFKVETSTYGAEYGHGIGQVNVITKSGTNEYHGTLFEFLRNAKLDARNYFDNPNNPIPPFKRNQFGFVLGGPIQIPHVVNGRDKLFFFVNYEGLRQRKALTSLSTLPFAEDRTGDFSGSPTIIYDPLTRGPDGATPPTAFPGNRIPASRISPVALYAFQHFIPLPNRSSTVYANNFLSNESERQDGDQLMSRVDWAHTANSSFQFRYSTGNESQYSPRNIPLQGGTNDTITHQSLLGHTWAIGANKVNELKFGISRLEADHGNLHSFDPEWDIPGKLGIPDVNKEPVFFGIPVLNITRFSEVGDPQHGPYLTWDTMIQVRDNFSWNKGTHSFKFGTEIMRTRFNITGNDVARGRFGFNGQYTNVPGTSPNEKHTSAQFLLGLMSSAENQAGLVVSNLRNYSLNYYFQDVWKVTPKLTVNYGLRYELQPGYHDTRDRLVNVAFRWDDSLYPTFVRAGTGDPYEAGTPPPWPLPADIPYVRDGRFGNTTYRTDGNNFAPRLGLAYSPTTKTVIRSGFGIYYVHDIGNGLFDVMRNPPFTLRRSETASTLVPTLSWNRPFALLGRPTLTPAFQWGEPTSYVAQWSFGIQRELAPGMSLEAGYVGSAGIKLERTIFYNEAPAGPPGNQNLRRPFPTVFANLQLVARPAHSSYHSLQLRLQRRFSRGFTVLTSFTYGKSIDNGSGVRAVSGDAYTPANSRELWRERGLSAFDFRKRLTTSFLYELPFGTGKAFLDSAHPVVNAVLGGWQMGGIFTLQDGFPFTVLCSANATYQNSSGACRADAVGTDPELPRDQRGPSGWFNRAAFVDRLDFVRGVGPYRYGNSGRNNVIGPGIIELDFSLAKSFRPTERTRLDLRAEFFNLPNHPIFGQPGSTVATSTYGVISSTRLDSRQIQFGLKLVF